MGTFSNKPYGHKSTLGPLAAQAKKRPFLVFGLPFLAVMVAGSFGLSQLTQTKFDHRDRRHTKVTSLRNLYTPVLYLRTKQLFY